MSGPHHSRVSGGEPPAFLICQFCGMEHTLRSYLGVPGPPFWIREPEGEWKPKIPPIPPCPWAHYVRHIVNHTFRLPSPEDGGAARDWTCHDFDPRHGYRLITTDDRGPRRIMDVSPRNLPAR